jgi:hypothetical protein
VSNLLVSCKCGKVLLNITKSGVESEKECGRYFLCPQKKKDKTNCKECSFFSYDNDIEIQCPYCGKKIIVSLPKTKVFIAPEDLTLGFSNILSSYGNKVIIKEINFEKENTKIILEKDD